MTSTGTYTILAFDSYDGTNTGAYLLYLRKSNTPPNAFNKFGPANGALNQSLRVTLNWNASLGESSYQYCYSKTNPCSNWISNGTSNSKTISGLAQHTTYYWQARAVNSYGTTFANGTTADWSFTTGPSSVSTFQSIGPQDGWILELQQLAT